MSDPKSAVSGKKTLVEEGTEFKGSLSSNCPIEVKGAIQGDLTAPSLAVSASGSVHGKVRVGEIRSQGELAGEFDADVVQLSGTVKDNTVIRAKSLEVKLASAGGKMQVIFGECELDISGEQPAKETGKEPATAKPKPQASVRPPAPEAEAAVATERTRSVPPKGEKAEKAASIPPPADTNGAG
jgi:cytoskeletal protein CcmA (bactofilin family)